MHAPDVRLASDAIRCLAGSLDAGGSVRGALMGWWRVAPERACTELRRLAARIALGERPGSAIAKASNLFGPHAALLGALVAMSERLGGDRAKLLNGLADEIDKVEASGGHAKALIAGSVLSARVVGALPLIALPVLPSALERSGAAGISAVGLGISLCVAGVVWMRRLLPKDQSADAVASVADCVAVACEAGVEMDRAFDALASSRIPELESELLRLRRMARLGLGWTGALVWSRDERLVAIGRSLRTAKRHGTPCATLLRDRSRHLRAKAASEAERAARRAPVAMVLPLALCLLPGFALLLIVPFARAVAP